MSNILQHQSQIPGPGELGPTRQHLIDDHDSPNWRLRPRRSVIQTSLVIKASRRREESGDRHLHHLIFFNFKATLRLRLIKQYQLIRPCPQATCVFFHVRLTFRFDLVWWDLIFFKVYVVLQLPNECSNYKILHFTLYFRKLYCFITNLCNFCCATTVKMLYNKTNPHPKIFYFVKGIITIPQHMKLALKFDILHLIASQIVI